MALASREQRQRWNKSMLMHKSITVLVTEKHPCTLDAALLVRQNSSINQALLSYYKPSDHLTQSLI
jgi:hypothetical protein